MFDEGEARREIGLLIGCPFTEIGRVGVMAILGFGRTVSGESGSGRTVTGSQYAFHVQCPFRILQGNRIVLGSGEMNFDLDKAPYDDGAKVVEGFLSAARPEVLRVSINGFGDVRIEMDHEIKLEIFPTSSSSRPEERWRFLARFGTHYSFPDGLDRPA